MEIIETGTMSPVEMGKLPITVLQIILTGLFTYSCKRNPSEPVLTGQFSANVDEHHVTAYTYEHETTKRLVHETNLS